MISWMLFAPFIGTMLVTAVSYLPNVAIFEVMLARLSEFVFSLAVIALIFASFGVIVSSCNFFISASRAVTLVVLLLILFFLCPYSMKRTIVKIRKVARVPRIPINGQFLGSLALHLSPTVKSVGLLEPSLVYEGPLAAVFFSDA